MIQYCLTNPLFFHPLPGTPSEIDGSKVRGGDHNIPKQGAVGRDKVDHPVRDTRLTKHFENSPIGEHGRVRGLPQHHVPHQGWGGDQVPTNGREVERGDGSYETLQSSVHGPVPGPVGMERGLGLVYLHGVLHTKSQEVC